MKKVVIYHNPRCTKSRQTLALLTERGIEPEVIEYLKQPPSAAEVQSMLRKLGIPPHELLRKKEAPYTAHRLSSESNAADVARAIAKDPILLERPVVVVGDRAAIGRPPEAVLSLIE